MDTLAKGGGTAGAGDIPLNDFLPPEAPIRYGGAGVAAIRAATGVRLCAAVAPAHLRADRMAILAAAGYYEMYRVLQSAAKAPSSNLTNLMDALRGQSPR
jgi:membrane glycosyltransferase